MGRPSVSFGRIELVGSTEGATEEAPAPSPAGPETPFRLAVLGDFSGRAGRGVRDAAGLAVRRPVAIDRDNFDDVMARLGVEAHLDLGGDGRAPVVFRFRELDDFHPDRIVATEMFRGLESAIELGARPAPASAPAPAPAPAPRQEPATPDEPGRPTIDLLDRILAESRGREPAPARESGAFGEFLERITAAHRVAPDDPRQAGRRAALDAAKGDLLRAVLHHPRFRALEAAWRGLAFLTRRLETDSQLSISLIDVSEAELADDLVSAKDLGETASFKGLVEPAVGTAGGRPWAALIGADTFEPVARDVALLWRLGRLGRLAGAPFLAAASPRFLGVDSLAATPDPDDWGPIADPAARDAWEALRRAPEAAYLGLALPRFLLRPPYDPIDAPIEAFRFAESPRPDEFPWGSPAFALAELLGRAFSQYGWAMRPGAVQEIDDLPLHIDRTGDEPEATPCAEAWLTHRAAEAALDRGLMPLLSIRGRDALRLGRFQSISEPATALAGRWE